MTEIHHPYCLLNKISKDWICSCGEIKSYDRYLRSNFNFFVKSMTPTQRVKFFDSLKIIKQMYRIYD